MMRVNRFLAAAAALFIAVLPARADQQLGSGRILGSDPANGDIYLGPLKVGRRQNGRTTLQPEKIEIQGSGSTGPVDTTTVAGRYLSDRALDAYNVKDAGAKCDGVTNDYAAFVYALITRPSFPGVANKDVYAPGGTCLVVIPSGGSLGSAVGAINIRGSGLDTSRVVIKTSDGSYINALRLANSGIRFSDLWIDFQIQPGQSASLFLAGGPGMSGLSFQRVRLTSNSTISNGTPTSTSYAINLAGDLSDFEFADGEMYGWAYTNLKTNTQTSTQRRWSYRGSYFHDNLTGDVGANSPAGIFDDFSVISCTFGTSTPFNGDAGLNAPIGFASVSNVKLISNTFIGYTAAEAIHIEQASGKVIVASNILNVTSIRANWGKGIAILNNNISVPGGTHQIPSDIIVSANIITRTDGVSDGTGIDVVYDASGQPGGTRYVVADNIVKGFKYGIGVPQLAWGSRVSGNLISASTACVAAYGGSTDIRDNILEGCTTGITSQMGGIFGRQKFVNVPTLASGTAGFVVLRGWSQEFETTTVPNGTATVDLGTVGQRLQGTVRMLSRGPSSPNQMFGEYALVYDGTSLKPTANLELPGGGYLQIGTGSFTLSSGSPKHLQAGTYTGNSAAVPLSVSVVFDGEQIF
jgi:hypothetical protein